MSAALERSGGGGDGKLESEAGAATGAGAFSGQVAAHLFGGESPAVEAKAVPVFAGGETVMKDPRQVLRGNANAIVVDSQSHTTIIADDREGDLLVGWEESAQACEALRMRLTRICGCLVFDDRRPRPPGSRIRVSPDVGAGEVAGIDE